MDEIGKKIRPLYSELRGYLSVAPEDHYVFDDMAINLSRQFNGTIDELNVASGQSYDKFKVQTKNIEWNRSMQTVIESLDYRNKLSGLINKLQGEFFSDEQIASTHPSTVINAHQTQSQTQQQSIVVDIAMLVAEKRSQYADGTPERTFLDRLGEALKSARGVQDILNSIFSLATSTGVGLEFLKKIFGL